METRERLVRLEKEDRRDTEDSLVFRVFLDLLYVDSFSQIICR